jgi:hypothetical protein
MLSHLIALEESVARKPTDTVQLKLRFPEALRRRLERQAALKKHSMNAEIVDRLTQSLLRESYADFIATTVRDAIEELRELDPQTRDTLKFMAMGRLRGLPEPSTEPKVRGLLSDQLERHQRTIGEQPRKPNPATGASKSKEGDDLK